MQKKNHQGLGWRCLYAMFIALILTAILLRSSTKGPSVPSMSSDQHQFTEASTVSSTQDQLTESSPGNQDQLLESFSDNQDQFTEKESSAEALANSPENALVSVNPEDNMENMDSPSVMAEETENTVDNFGAPSTNSTASIPLEREYGGVANMSSSNTQVCDYSKGRWVADSRRPFYSGFGCRRWLPKAWACRLTRRTDFSYEGYRWQPVNCEIPEFNRFTFLTKMQDKTIAFIGDSLGRQQFHSLMCMATGGEESPEVEDVGREYGLVKHPGAIRPDGWAFRFPSTNTTILFYWSSTLCKLERINSLDSHFKFALHLDHSPSFMRKFLPRFDILVLNTAHHWIRTKFIANGWTMYLNGKPIKDGILVDMTNVKNYTVHRVVRWLDSQISLRPQLKAFFRTRSPRHLVNGDSNSGGNCNNTTPLNGGSEVMQDGSSDKVVASAVKGTRVKILDISALSSLRDEAHKSNYGGFGTSVFYDCLHWCLPGVPDTWNELLIAQL
ncbi:hypothetical protein SLE2022_292610 [Rubroshorea leprosula]